MFITHYYFCKCLVHQVKGTVVDVPTQSLSPKGQLAEGFPQQPRSPKDYIYIPRSGNSLNQSKQQVMGQTLDTFIIQISYLSHPEIRAHELCRYPETGSDNSKQPVQFGDLLQSLTSNSPG